MRMRIIYFLVFLWCAPVFATPEARLGELLSHFNSYSAHFTQKTYANRQQARITEGEVVLLRPGYFRWETTTPLNQSIIATPKNVWIYDVELAQATHSQMNDEGGSSPAHLLSGSNNYIQSQFTISRYVKTGSEEQFYLSPKQSNTNFSAMQLTFRNNELVGMQYKN